jgi:outer membrane lipoprotein-sorting protein
MKRTYAFSALLFCLVLAAGAQEMVTAEQFFAKVSSKYATIDDYDASVTIASSGQPMTGKLYFKSPSLLRIDFSQPPDQVIVFDGEKLLVYIPQYKAVLQQETGAAGVGAGAASLASREGLSMMKRNYTIAWESAPQAVPLDQGGQAPSQGQGQSEMVHKLLLTRKSVSEGFKTIKISISESSLLIRRIEGWTVANERIAFDFSNVKLNQSIPATKFLYDAPASANVYNNFLFQ